MKKLLFAVLLVCFAAGIAVAADGPAQVTYDTKMGAVSFDHAAHKAKVSDCNTCHHKGVEAGACKACHGVDPAAPKAKDAFHDQCKGCHQKMSGPTGCKDCHKK